MFRYYWFVQMRQAPDAHGVYKIPELSTCAPPTPAATVVAPHPRTAMQSGILGAANNSRVQISTVHKLLAAMWCRLA